MKDYFGGEFFVTQEALPPLTGQTQKYLLPFVTLLPLASGAVFLLEKIRGAEIVLRLSTGTAAQNKKRFLLNDTIQSAITEFKNQNS